VEIPLFVANISDECILGIDFLQKIKLEGIFESEFGNFEKENEDKFPCLRITLREIPNFLKSFYGENFFNLNSSQRDIFANFLIEFQDIFSQDLIAGNCGILEHSIEVTDSKPIKQISRRVPIHLRGEVDRIVTPAKLARCVEHLNLHPVFSGEERR